MQNDRVALHPASVWDETRGPAPEGSGRLLGRVEGLDPSEPPLIRVAFGQERVLDLPEADVVVEEHRPARHAGAGPADRLDELFGVELLHPGSRAKCFRFLGNHLAQAICVLHIATFSLRKNINHLTW